MKTYFDGFQCCEFPSGVVATPASPKAPALVSGAIVRNDTAVEIVLGALRPITSLSGLIPLFDCEYPHILANKSIAITNENLLVMLKYFWLQKYIKLKLS